MTDKNKKRTPSKRALKRRFSNQGLVVVPEMKGTVGTGILPRKVWTGISDAYITVEKKK